MRFTIDVPAKTRATVKRLVADTASDEFVLHRVRRNVTDPPAVPSLSDFWLAQTTCILTSQQPSGPGGHLSKFLKCKPFPLGFDVVRRVDRRRQYFKSVVKRAGLRFPENRARFFEENWTLLNRRIWQAELLPQLVQLAKGRTPQLERKVSSFIAETFSGVGPKQARNTLQELGLTQFEVPLDSRIIKQLRVWGFPVPLSGTLLSDTAYYEFVLDCFIQLARQCEVIPCVLDAAIFVAGDKQKWTSKDVEQILM